MRRHERGVTFLGWLILLTPVAVVFYAGIRLTPLYLEYTKIARTLEQVRDENSGNQVEARTLRVAIERRFDIESVTVIDRDDVVITKDGNGYIIEASYTDSAPLFGNVSLNVDFSKVVQIE
jgi:hypothetical protein